jgi:acetolactate synthase-1/2/3 large subunit
MPFRHQLRIGTFGTHGTRFANFAVQNSDFVLSIGTRLDTKATGTPPSTFARGAWKAVNDISSDELEKFEKLGLDIDLKIRCDAKILIQTLLENMSNSFQLASTKNLNNGAYISQPYLV